MAAGDLSTLTNVKQWLGVTTTTDDTLLQRLLTAASGYIQSWLNRTFASAGYTDTFDGNGKDRLMLRNYPVTAVASVTIDGTVIPASTGVTVNGWLLDETGKMVILRNYWFNRGTQNIVISYTAGYATTPPEIEEACIELIGLRYRERDRIGQVSKAIGGETVSFTQKDMSDSIKTILNNYKKVVPL